MNKWISFTNGFMASISLIASILVFNDNGFCPMFVIFMMGFLLWIGNNALEEK